MTSARRTTAIQCPARLGTALLQALERPARVLGEQLVVPGGLALDRRALGVAADVARCDQGVPLQPAPVVPRHVEAGVAQPQLVLFRLEPVHKRDRRCGRVITSCSWPRKPPPARAAASRSTCWFASTRTR